MAVKVLAAEDGTQQEDFRREAAMLEGLRHTHVVNYLGHAFEENGEVSTHALPFHHTLLLQDSILHLP